MTLETRERRDSFLSTLHVHEGKFSLCFFREAINECSVLTLRLPHPLQEEEEHETSVVDDSGEIGREEVRERRESEQGRKEKERMEETVEERVLNVMRRMEEKMDWVVKKQESQGIELMALRTERVDVTERREGSEKEGEENDM